MIIKNVTLAEVSNAARAVGLALADEEDRSSTRTQRVKTRLRLGEDRGFKHPRYPRLGLPKYQRMNHRGDRRVAAVCWHGHRDFFRALFALAPRAVVSVSARMNGEPVVYTAENFETTFHETGDRNIGSMFEPCAFRDACICEE